MLPLVRTAFLHCRAASWLLLSVMTCGLSDSAVLAQRRPVEVSVPMTLYTPEPQQLNLALDEIELDWSEQDPGRTLSGSPNPVPNTRLTTIEATRAIFAVSDVSTPEGLAAVSRALESVNPGAEANFVLYELEGRSVASRRVLTTHTALILEDPSDPTGALIEYAARNPQPLEGVPGGYLLEGSDPLSAVQLADALRDRAGVKSAYPLVKRRQFLR